MNRREFLKTSLAAGAIALPPDVVEVTHKDSGFVAVVHSELSWDEPNRMALENELRGQIEGAFEKAGIRNVGVAVLYQSELTSVLEMRDDDGS